jgi:hypothetical protein
MPKYRALYKEELLALEKEFVEYLVLNSITSDEWVKIKDTDPSKATKIIELFSDVVFEKILRSVRFLDYYSKSSIKTFKCEADKISLIGMDTEDQNYDFSTPEGVAYARDYPPKDLSVYTKSKSYSSIREMEIFGMMADGCQVSKGEIYLSLEKAIS